LEALEKEEDEREKTGFYKLDGLDYDSGKDSRGYCLYDTDYS